MSDNRSKLSKNREILEEKLRKRQEESAIRKQRTPAKNGQVKLSDTTKNSNYLLNPNPSVNFNTPEEPVFNKVINNTLNGSNQVNQNFNMANPDYKAKLKEVNKA